MARTISNGRLDAEQVLRRQSEQEAIDFSEQPEAPATLHQTANGTPTKQHNTIARLWCRHVSISVPHDTCRDHFANERTALGWIRTAQAFAMLGVVIAQLTRLAQTSSPDLQRGGFELGVPLSSACHAMALLVTIVGSYRFFRWQAEMTKGHALSGGWEIIVVAGLACVGLLSVFILFVIVS